MAHPTPDVHIWPKIELHRHLEGSVRLETAWAWAQHSPTLRHLATLEELRPLIQFDGVATYTHFLGKFETLRQLYYDPAAIVQVTQEAIADAAADNVRYLELRVSPDHFARQAGFDLAETAALIFSTGQAAAQAEGITVRFLCTITRLYSAETAALILEIALAHRHLGVVGLDISGDEFLETTPALQGLVAEAARAGLGISVHAGEAGPAAHVWHAIEVLNAHRIAHGISSVTDPSLLATLQQRCIPLEVCPTSNLHTGVVTAAALHPLTKLVRSGAPVALSTDDPAISNITLSDEYDFALTQAGLTVAELATLTLQAADYTFLPDNEKRTLRAQMETELSTLLNLPT